MQHMVSSLCAADRVMICIDTAAPRLPGSAEVHGVDGMVETLFIQDPHAHKLGRLVKRSVEAALYD